MARKHFVIHSCFHLTQLWRVGNSNCRGRLSVAAAQPSPRLGGGNEDLRSVPGGRRCHRACPSPVAQSPSSQALGGCVWRLSPWLGLCSAVELGDGGGSSRVAPCRCRALSEPRPGSPRRKEMLLGLALLPRGLRAAVGWRRVNQALEKTKDGKKRPAAAERMQEQNRMTPRGQR